MKSPTYFRFTKIEIAFLLTAFAVLLIGTIIATLLGRPGLMPGVGAIIIVLGVIFAMAELPNLLALNAEKLFNLRKNLAAHSAINEEEENRKTILSDEEKSKITKKEHLRIEKDLPNQAPYIRKRFHIVEVFIVCFGTLVNGFGQIILELYVKCA